jgi:hypothetical protein
MHSTCTDSSKSKHAIWLFVEFYDKGGIRNGNLDERIVRLNLPKAEKMDLAAFLKALNGAPIPVMVPTAFLQ